MTAQQLLDALASAGVSVSVDGIRLVVAGTVPSHLAPLLKILHTGVRASLTGRQWWGLSSDTGRVVELHTAAVIPIGVTLLCVEGDGKAGGKWDRIRADAWIDHPELFDVPKGKKGKAA